jgi:hypothetical protein
MVANPVCISFYLSLCLPPPPTKPSFDAVTEMICSIQHQMEAIDPARLQSGEGVQLDFAEAVEEDPFGLGPTDPLRGLGLSVAKATAEKDVGTSGLPGGGCQDESICVFGITFPAE